MAQHPSPTNFGAITRFREEWLSRADAEPVLEPALPIVDTHVHLWRPNAEYQYFVEDYAKDIRDSGHNVEASIFVECNAMYRATGPNHLKPVGETEFAVGQAAIAASGIFTSSRIAAGIVAFADMMLGDQLDEVLDAQAAAANGRLRGIRQRAKWDPDPVIRGRFCADGPQLYLSPELHRGVRKLGPRGLLFEASIFHTQLVDVVALARKAPDTQIVVIHSGSPLGHSAYKGHEKQVYDIWLSGMTELALCPNVAIKMGGLLMTLAAFDYGVAARPISSEELARLWRSYIVPCVELFGPDRCMVSSNFPVDKMGFSYGTCWNMFKRLFANHSEGDKRKLFSGAASRIYRI